MDKMKKEEPPSIIFSATIRTYCTCVVTFKVEGQQCLNSMFMCRWTLHFIFQDAGGVPLMEVKHPFL